jgi:hypothetical protein
MSQNLLDRVRIWTTFLALAVSVTLWRVISFDFAAGVFLTALWAVAGLLALEKLLKTAIVPKGTERNGFVVSLWVLAKLAVYAIAVWVLFSRPFPAVSHAVGFTLMMVVLVILGARVRADESRRSAHGMDADRTDSVRRENDAQR